MAAETIRIIGARQHNLKNVSIEFPRERLVVFTGMSGSGKSSLAFDTLYAEGQRRYVESLSAYARQFLDQMEKPEVDFIEGLSPAIAIEQRSSVANPRSTIATTTEIYDYLRVLFSVIGQPHDPVTGDKIFKQTPQQIVDQILAYSEETRVLIIAPIIRHETGEFRDVLEKIKREGFVRIRVDGEVLELARPEPIRLAKTQHHTIEIVVDRLVIREGVRTRLADSVDTALMWGKNRIIVSHQRPDDTGWEDTPYSTHFCNPKTDFLLPELTPKHFSFNSLAGACPECQGLGSEGYFDPELVIPDPTKSLTGGAIAPWRKATKRMQSYYNAQLKALANLFGISLETPFADLPADFKKALLYGTGNRAIQVAFGEKIVERPFDGVIAQLENLFQQTESEFTRSRLKSYQARRSCRLCQGARLRPEILAVTIRDLHDKELNIHEFCALTTEEAKSFIENIHLSKHQRLVAAELLREIRNRLTFLVEVGLGYLTLNRESGTLSGGEAQRIRLGTQIGSGLAGVLYVLDEPSIGLHQRDNDRLLATLKHLRDLGNTVVVVEHDEDTIRAADFIIDLGPGAGPRGGQIVASGSIHEIESNPESLTGQYLSGALRIPIPRARVLPKGLLYNRDRIPDPGTEGWLTVVGAKENNLRDLTVSFPLGCFVCVTGVSGSGKSTLVDDILRKSLFRHFYKSKDRPGAHRSIEGINQVDKAIVIDQSPIGRTPRSNAATYSGAFGPIRELFSQLPASRIRGYDSGRFSFNLKGGRCENCQGDGVIKIEMHFLADVYVECEVCRGARYNRETLEITFRGKNVSDVLKMSVDEAARFFRNVPAIFDKLEPLVAVGLGYLTLGQSGTQLSGGEAQRVKLAAELAKKATGRTVYILDEPTTGLHFADIQKLLEVLLKLRDQGNTLIVIEHNLEVIKCADWVIDLGPEGGRGGGQVIAQGTPEQVVLVKGSHTGRYLQRALAPE
ncbi:MAG: excinuclease subunit [Verrucomicrobiota bacterium]|jgi:excinuclease ABC subunit A|nr:excinuclease subunit [Verrucomicrobiota bacterium]